MIVPLFIISIDNISSNISNISILTKDFLFVDDSATVGILSIIRHDSLGIYFMT